MLIVGFDLMWLLFWLVCSNVWVWLGLDFVNQVLCVGGGDDVVMLICDKLCVVFVGIDVDQQFVDDNGWLWFLVLFLLEVCKGLGLFDVSKIGFVSGELIL